MKKLLGLILIGHALLAQESLRVESKAWVSGNPNTPWKFYDTRSIKTLASFSPKSEEKLNKYGSLPHKKVQGSGYYRTEKIDGRWWVVDPEGHLNIQTVLNSVRPGTSERNETYLKSLYGNKENWLRATADSLSKFGFTGTGSWSEDVREINKQREKPLSYTPNLNFMSTYGKKRGGTYQLPGNVGYPNQTIFAFDPDFEEFCKEHAKSLKDRINDPNLFGVFSDNELPIGLGNLEGYLKLANDQDPGKQEALRWLAARRKTIDEIADDDRADFAGHVAETYYRKVAQALKEVLPHHMYLGSRLHGGAKFIIPVLKAAGKYCDIVSFNYYGVWTPEEIRMEQWQYYTGKPFMITEFYTKAMDAGLANTTGAGFTVRTQKDKALAYQHFTLALLESKACVGWHYFKYQDNDPTAKGVDPSNIDSNKGIVNNEYVYYSDLMKGMKEMHLNRYALIEYFDQNQEAKEWKLVWSDEFDYKGLPDPKKWSHDTRGNSYGWGNRELQWYTIAKTENTLVSDGTLKIIARKEETKGKNYSSGRLMTKYKGDWLYGKIEIRAKVPKGKGTWPAIWMLSTENHYGTWPKSGEIDIMEHVGANPDTVFSTTHTESYNHILKTQKKGITGLSGLTDDFHTYTLEWEQSKYQVYFDGKLLFTFENEGTGSKTWPYDRPFHLILNLAIGGGLGGPVDDSLFPHTFEIDYVRVYQKK
ncbi:glycoside hydrolase family 16 [Leadbetterella byssophila DSM 17132]|uniref:Glycoside hydrolase family 16 n=1 Tax=Leadbetterella byssophila (strain DSM 17132 / JCM 16389 / KACC 11308 / NBRC 106382 / 4M15) TaxID=649349 RepID=E4RVE3_LEAB4|nr:glycoside hydrolase family 16 protein [Leadbetterella byssophila]ADQ16129.1 glycoside hydrolase family 16 [Leadbetterella byssophila DSM 17132]